MVTDEREIMARGLMYPDDYKWSHLKCIILTWFCFYKVWAWTWKYAKVIVAKEIQIEILIFMLGPIPVKYVIEFLSLM